MLTFAVEGEPALIEEQTKGLQMSRPLDQESQKNRNAALESSKSRLCM